MQEEKDIPRKTSRNWIGWIVTLFIVAIIAAGITALVARQRPDILGLASATNTQLEVESLVAQVGRLMELPDEQPTVATVTDVEKLKNQPFFAKSQNGDKVLIFTNAKKAVLYRPSTNLIIDVAPVTLGSDATASAQTSEPQTSTVVLRNGTSIVGLTRTYESVIKQKTPTLTVVDRENATRSDWEKSILVDVSGQRSSEAQNLAQVLGITVEPLPAQESTPSADFLIILGQDQK